MNKQEKYQGWTNAQTWCVALWLNNDKYTQDKALNLVRDNGHDLFVAASLLASYCSRHSSSVIAMAPWAWETSLLVGVNWREIAEQFAHKLKEMSDHEQNS